MPIVADAAVKIGADLSQFKRDLKGVDKQTQTLGQRMKSTFSPGGLGFTAAAAGIAAFAAGIGQAIGDLINMERISAQTDAAIRSTGGAANVSRDQIVGMAESLESLTGIEMETVQEGENMLLTFTKVRNEVGAGNDVFNQATEAALDMSVALGTDMTSAAMLVGKALNDPIKGMTAMTRAGIQFTEQQKAQIKTMVESGDILGAQKIILAELETQFGNSAEAFGTTMAGKMAKAGNFIGNVFEGIVTGAVDMVTDTAGLFNNFALDFGDMGDRTHRLADRLGEDFNTVKERVRAEMDATGRSFEDVMAGMEADAYEKAAGITDAMSEGVRFAAQAVERGGPVIAAAWDRAKAEQQAALDRIVAAAHHAGMDSIVEFAAGMLQKQNDPQLALDAMHKAMHEGMTRAQEIAFLDGQLTGSELARALNSEVPSVRLAAEAARAVIVERLESLGVDAQTFGYNIGKEMAAGIDLSKPVVRTAAGGLAEAVRGQIGILSEPKDADSPLRGITRYGGNIVKEIAGGIFANLGLGRAAGSALAAALVPGFGGVPMAPGMAGAAGGSVSNTYNVDARDRIRGHSIDDIGYGLKRLGEMGVLPGTPR